MSRVSRECRLKGPSWITYCTPSRANISSVATACWVVELRYRVGHRLSKSAGRMASGRSTTTHLIYCNIFSTDFKDGNDGCASKAASGHTYATMSICEPGCVIRRPLPIRLQQSRVVLLRHLELDIQLGWKPRYSPSGTDNRNSVVIIRDGLLSGSCSSSDDILRSRVECRARRR